MLNSIQLAGLVVISLLLLFQLRFAAKRDRPVLLVITLACLVYFVYAAGIRLDWYIREWSHNFDVKRTLHHRCDVANRTSNHFAAMRLFDSPKR